jgi:excisionase family DNA binding protein
VSKSNETLYDKDEAAAYLKTSRRHVERLWATRRISGRKIGRFVRFTQRDLDNYIEDCLVEAVTK